MKKGFTLIELLGTILILSAIILIIAPLILNRINKGKEIVDKQSEESLVLSAQSWGSNNRDKLPMVDGAYEYGSSRFMTKKEIKRNFKIWDIGKDL